MAERSKNEIAEAVISVKADGAADAKSELESLRATVARLSGEIDKLKGQGGADSEGSTNSGSGAMGLTSVFKRMLGIFGAGVGIKQFTDLAVAINAAHVEATRFQETLVKMQGDTAKATADTYTGIRNRMAENLGINPALLRGQGPNRIAAGEARAKAVSDAQAAVDEAMRAAAPTWFSDILWQDFVRSTFGTSFEEDKLRDARSNLRGVVQMQAAQAARGEALVDQADAIAMQRIFFGSMQDVASNTSAQLMRTPR